MALSKRPGVKSFPRGKKTNEKKETNKDSNNVTEEGGFEKGPSIGRTTRSDDDLFRVVNDAGKKKKNSQNTKMGTKRKGGKDGEGDAFSGFSVTHVESLSYRNLDEGMVLLGVVASVGEYEIKMSLPGHLVGSVPITNISKPYTRALRLLSEEASDEMIHIRPLKDMFVVGQVRLCAVEKIEISEEHHFHKITLTMVPQAVQNVPQSVLKKGMVLQAAIKSVEDHGFIMDVGVPGMIRAFLTHKRISQYVEKVLRGIAPTVGQLIPTLITNVDGDAGSLVLTADPVKIHKAEIDIAQVSSIHAMLPGMSFAATVDSEMRGGMKVKMGQFDAYVHRDHIAREVDEGDSVNVKVLFVLPTVNMVHVSCKEHLTFAAKGQEERAVALVAKVGQLLVKSAEVIDSSRSGLVLKLSFESEDDEKHEELGWVSARQVTDQKEIPNLKEKYPAGTKVSCRIIQYDHSDAMFICSMQKSMLQKDATVGQLKIGDRVSCKVKSFVKAGVIVEVAGKKNVEGFVPTMHLSNVPLKNPEKKFPPGTKLSCRVLRADPKRKRMHLTNKSILVKEEYPIVCTYDPSTVGLVTEGVVLTISPAGLLLQLFGDVKGWVPKSKMSTETIEYPEKLFFVGQTLKCEILDVDVAKERMTLSLIIGGTHKPLGSKEKRSGDGVKLGSFYDCVVAERSDEGLAVEISLAGQKTTVKGFIPKQHLTDHTSLADSLLETYSVGDKIMQALCFERDVMPILTLKPLIVEAAQSGTLPKSYEDLQVGICVPGVVCLMKDYGVFLKLPTWKFRKSALVPMRYLADVFVEDPSSYVSLNQTVVGKIVERSDEDQKITMSLKMKDMELGSMDQAVKVLSNYFGEISRLRKQVYPELLPYRAGQTVTCTVVKKVTNVGLEVICQGVRGIITSSGLTGLPSSPNVGDFLSAVVLFVDFEYGCLELSSVPDLVKRSTLARSSSLLDPDSVVKASVVLVKSIFNFAALSVKSGPASGTFVYIPTQYHINDQEGFADTLAIGDLHNVTIKATGDDAVIGVLERQERRSLSKRTRKISIQEEITSPKRLRKVSSSEPVKPQLISSELSNQDAVSDQPKEKVNLEEQSPMDPGWDDDFDPWAKKKSSNKQTNAPAAEEESAASLPSKKLKSHVSKKEKKELSRLEAEEIARAEQRILDGEEAEPETAEEFDRLVLAAPDSSLCWVKYMAHHIGRKEYERAREVAGRALEKINLREDEERLNVYMALLNLENSFGDDQSTEDLLAKALKFNDQYKVYAQAANIFDLSGKTEKAEKLYKIMAKRFCMEPEVWVKLGMHYFAQKNLKEARFTLQRSMQNLEKKNHVEMSSKFGQLEFKVGEVERGKTIFETILGNFPGRTDLWSVYVDMLVKAGEVDAARGVLERTILLNLQPKKMKFFFKKYLQFEEGLGNAQGVDHVRRKALDYVETKAC